MEIKIFCSLPPLLIKILPHDSFIAGKCENENIQISTLQKFRNLKGILIQPNF